MCYYNGTILALNGLAAEARKEKYRKILIPYNLLLSHILVAVTTEVQA